MALRHTETSAAERAGTDELELDPARLLGRRHISAFELSQQRKTGRQRRLAGFEHEVCQGRGRVENNANLETCGFSTEPPPERPEVRSNLRVLQKQGSDEQQLGVCSP